jgi:hypothetical protein
MLTRTLKLARSVAMLVVLLALALPGIASAGLVGSLLGAVGAVVGGVAEILAPPVVGPGPFVLNFEVLRPGTGSARMTISVSRGQTDLQFSVRNLRPKTVYTIWTVFYPLAWPLQFAPGGIRPLMDPNFPQGPPGFFSDGGVVAPTAPLSAEFTNGMGLDPGATFVTDDWGNGQVRVLLDFNILGNTYDDGPPVGNKVLVTQCVVDSPGPQRGPCPSPTSTMRVTTTWLRKFIAQVPPADRARLCANYKDSAPEGIYWQCIDPATYDSRTGTGLPRVWRFPFDHFRLAAHPDGLTHGFIGGNEVDHVIDMVGRRCRLTNTCP